MLKLLVQDSLRSDLKTERFIKTLKILNFEGQSYENSLEELIRQKDGLNLLIRLFSKDITKVKDNVWRHQPLFVNLGISYRTMKELCNYYNCKSIFEFRELY
jgi:hypothetical protein